MWPIAAMRMEEGAWYCSRSVQLGICYHRMRQLATNTKHEMRSLQHDSLWKLQLGQPFVPKELTTVLHCIFVRFQ